MFFFLSIPINFFFFRCGAPSDNLPSSSVCGKKKKNRPACKQPRRSDPLPLQLQQQEQE